MDHSARVVLNFELVHIPAMIGELIECEVRIIFNCIGFSILSLQNSLSCLRIRL